MENKPLYPIIKLKRDKDEAALRFHPWIFSGAIDTAAEGLQAGDLVTVVNHNDEVVGTGFCEAGNIAVKLLCFDNRKIGALYWQERLNAAFEVRKVLGFVGNKHTNCFRLVHSEGDGLPGLIVDIYGHTAVIQTQTEGMALNIKAISAALQAIPELELEAIYNKSAEVMQRIGDEAIEDGYLFGSPAEDFVLENDMKFIVDWEQGQKTGFFLDQRDNRELVGRMAQNRKVLNAFGYTGGFTVSALKGGANEVVTVDSSRKAIEMAKRNIELNGYSGTDNQCVVADMKNYLKDMEDHRFDMIILDPPAFAKGHQHRHKGLQGYKYINYEAIRKIAPNGLLFTFSCSQAVDRAMFQGIVTAAAIEAKREVRILHHLSQPADHPTNIFHPEGTYLKGLVLMVR